MSASRATLASSAPRSSRSAAPAAASNASASRGPAACAQAARVDSVSRSAARHSALPPVATCASPPSRRASPRSASRSGPRTSEAAPAAPVRSTSPPSGRSRAPRSAVTVSVRPRKRREARAHDTRGAQAERVAEELLLGEHLRGARAAARAERAARRPERGRRVGIHRVRAVHRLAFPAALAGQEHARPELGSPPAAHRHPPVPAPHGRAGGGEGGIAPGAGDGEPLVVREVEREPRRGAPGRPHARGRLLAGLRRDEPRVRRLAGERDAAEPGGAARDEPARLARRDPGLLRQSRALALGVHGRGAEDPGASSRLDAALARGDGLRELEVGVARLALAPPAGVARWTDRAARLHVHRPRLTAARLERREGDPAVGAPRERARRARAERRPAALRRLGL